MLLRIAAADFCAAHIILTEKSKFRQKDGLSLIFWRCVQNTLAKGSQSEDLSSSEWN